MSILLSALLAASQKIGVLVEALQTGSEPTPEQRQRLRELIAAEQATTSNLLAQWDSMAPPST